MTVFTIEPSVMPKWAYQNEAEPTGDFYEGSLLDGFVMSCKRGYAFVYEMYVNPNQSTYRVEFIPNGDAKAIDEAFARFNELMAA